MEHGAPGESPMPDSDKLATCVIKQACDTIKEIIMEWAMEQAATKSAEWAAGKACEEAAGVKE